MDATVLPFLLMAGVAGILAFQWARRSARSRGFTALAAANPWSYAADRDTTVAQRYADFPLFREGDTRRAVHCVRGQQQGWPFEAFEYVFGRGSGKSRTTVYHAVARLEMPVDSPGLVIEEETLGLRVVDALTGGDIGFESHEFSKRFWVRGPDRKFAYAVIDARMMDYLLSLPRGWTWQWRGRDLLLYTRGHLEPGDVPAMVAALCGFRARLPRIVGGSGLAVPDAPALPGGGSPASAADGTPRLRPVHVASGAGLLGIAAIIWIFVLGSNARLPWTDPRLLLVVGVMVASGVSFVLKARRGDVE